MLKKKVFHSDLLIKTSSNWLKKFTVRRSLMKNSRPPFLSSVMYQFYYIYIYNFYVLKVFKKFRLEKIWQLNKTDLPVLIVKRVQRYCQHLREVFVNPWFYLVHAGVIGVYPMDHQKRSVTSALLRQQKMWQNQKNQVFRHFFLKSFLCLNRKLIGNLSQQSDLHQSVSERSTSKPKNWVETAVLNQQ